MLSIFPDEIAEDLEEQLEVVSRLGISAIDLRAVDGTGVLEFTDDQLAMIRDACAARSISVACVASPIGKSSVDEPIEEALARLERAFHVGRYFDCRTVRIFSFHVPKNRADRSADEFIGNAVERLRRLLHLAADEDFSLRLENEKGIIGDTVDRCSRIMEELGDEDLRFVWDPANFVQVGDAEQVTRGWEALGPYVGYVHVKDALLDSKQVVPAGEGDGEVPLLLRRLKESGYTGTFAVEPHLADDNFPPGISGPANTERAVSALRSLLDAEGFVSESKP
jgi:sugar phosphate isomerase/epimerase